MLKLLYTVDEASQTLGLGRSYIYMLLQSGELQSVKSGKRRLILGESIVRYIDALKAVA